MIVVVPISGAQDLERAFTIRRLVFVEEQHVHPDEEYDEFETTSTHFLARADGEPCGTARWRRTSNGVKLERFAVLADYRGKGVGKALVRTVLDDVFSQQPEPIEGIYLHAQLTAMPLYASFGFIPVGPMFEEAGIQHYKMVLPGSAYTKG
ncbi:GNAT family N-acetyltransferase [Spirosoma agri]|jgi:predicted GNAT family N-acyltransferase|uniref:GNAT family N-acetyltransferase n=1 Tax=Spirosoma agri TaxID=1987381 RepID=A0A6M0ILG3_9BACT|nr:GNAT family N-acetyltransferase [Spirosoma agri]NEU67743.1 GNAT family N-acetyltransferase [Spirosoma agri]